MNRFTASFFDGERAGSREVSVELLDSQRIRLLDGQYERYLGSDEFQAESRLGSGPAIITLHDGGRLEIGDSAGFFATLNRSTGKKNWVYWLETNWSLVFVMSAVTAVVVWFGIAFGVPVVAKTVAMSIPIELEQQIGEQGLELLDSAFLTDTELDGDRRAELDEVFSHVVNTVGEGQTYSLNYRSGGGIGANALALPSGIVVLTDELVAIAENDDEIAAVLAHEVGHAKYRHTLRSIIQGSVVAGLIITFTGDVGSAANLAAGIPTMLIERSYSRDFEREADEVAFEYLQLQQIPGQPLSDLLQRIDQAYGTDDTEPSLLQTHPRSAERVR